MKKLFLFLGFIAVSLCLFANSNDQAIELLSDKYPVRGGPTDVKDENSIKEIESEGTIIIEVPEILQDGYNYASRVDWNDKEGVIFRVVKHQGTTGYIAGATSNYKVYDNINATMIAKRIAYLNAYSKAKIRLVEGLRGFYIKRDFEMEKTVISIDDENKNIGSSLMTETDKLEKVVNGLMRGFATYQVSEREVDGVGKVFVSLILTPYTLATVNQMGHSVLIADDYLECLKIITADLNNNLDVPVGGKIILLPKQNKFAFVAFGSAIARYSEDKFLQSEYYDAAVEASRMRAAMGMLEILNGIDESWTSGIVDSTRYAVGQEKLDMDKITNEVTELDEENPILKNLLAKTLAKEFLNIFKKTDNYEYVVGGIVPPGTIQKTYETKECEENGYGWIYSIAVFYPEYEDDWEEFHQNLKIKTLIEEAKEELN